MNLTTLKSLQQSIRAATGPDREIDAEIAISLGLISGDVLWKIGIDGVGQRFACNPESGTEVLLRDFGRYLKLPIYTTNPDGLGACVSLLNVALPGALWARSPDGDFWAWTGDKAYANRRASPLANDCLTFIDAIISAAIAELEAKEAV